MITYYKHPSVYEGDITKNCSLTGGEVDNNFFFLREHDIENCYVEDGKLYLKRVNGDIVEGPIKIIQDINLSGSTFDCSASTLNIAVNGIEQEPIKIDYCDNRLEQLICTVNNLVETVNYLVERNNELEKQLKS